MCKKMISLFAAVVICFSFWSANVEALPQGGTVVGGSADPFVYAGNDLTITQNTDRMIAEWDGFSIGHSESVTFQQPSVSSIALNRVTGQDPSQIFGTLSANGRIFLINPNGVLFGPGSVVDVAGLVASTLNLNMSDTDFLSGNNNFTFSGVGGSVVNYGNISLNAPGGYVALLGASVKNAGLVEANLGKVILAAGEYITVDLDPLGLISVAVDIADVTTHNPDGQYAAVNNAGTIIADGGKVILSAAILDGIFDSAVNNNGIIEADVLNGVDGHAFLRSNQNIELNGRLVTSGSIEWHADHTVIFGKDVPDETYYGYSWKYVKDERQYKFVEFGYYFGQGEQRVILAQGQDIGKSQGDPTSGAGLAFPDQAPAGMYAIFRNGNTEYVYFQDAELNPDSLNHLVVNGTQHGWEDLLYLGDSDFDDAVIDFFGEFGVIESADPFISPQPPTLAYWENIEDEQRVYYEILNPSQYLAFEPATKLGLYAYHPLTPTDTSAFDNMALDIAAYEFIEGNINLSKAVPYLGI